MKQIKLIILALSLLSFSFENEVSAYVNLRGSQQSPYSAYQMLYGTSRPGRPILPAPVSNGNQKVELADGELYVLCGNIQEKLGVASFRVDFRFHPWLGSAKRLADPFYDLALDPMLAKAYFGRRVQLIAHAKGRVISVQPGLLDYMLILEPTEQGITLIGENECPAPKAAGEVGRDTF